MLQTEQRVTLRPMCYPFFFDEVGEVQAKFPGLARKYGQEIW